MLTSLFPQLKVATRAVLLLGLLTGVVYPLTITLLAQLLFHFEANGSLLLKNGTPIGSQLIGQAFSDPRYFHGRPSATADFPYNALQSGGSNLGPANPALAARVKEDVRLIRLASPETHALIPVDLVTASGSGLDPDISPAAALFQVHRIAKARGVADETIATLVHALIRQSVPGLPGEPRMNVLQANLALDQGHAR